jgi:hypothetical protein
VTRKYGERDPLDEARRAFALFVGDDPSGKISLRALRKVAKELNETLTDEELKGMIEEFDSDGDGYSDFTSQRTGVLGHHVHIHPQLRPLNAPPVHLFIKHGRPAPDLQEEEVHRRRSL